MSIDISAPAIGRNEAVRLLGTMLLIRTFEERAAAMFANQEITGGLHLAIGQEGVAAGVCAALEDGDYITSTHRGHHHCLARGADPSRMMAELFGRRSGYCGGKGGSMHIADASIGMLGANGIVGAGLPIAVGAGLACQVKYPGRAVVCFFGEGATNEGAFHESLNLASTWRLPVVFVCENNGFAEMMPAAQHMPVADVAARAPGYGMPGVIVDGNDVWAVVEAARSAVARARGGDGPTLIEAKTYRWRGHYEGDPQRYRVQAEVDAHRRTDDPVARWRARVLDMGLLGADDVSAAAAAAVRRVDEAVEVAREAGWPQPGDLMTNVYAS